MERIELINNTASTEHYFCEGAFATAQMGSYFLGMNLAAAKTRKQFSHDGSTTLDGINAFDLAEIQSAHLGQTNMIKVSSFCGPKGFIWGHDICKVPNLRNPWEITGDDVGRDVDIWDMGVLVDAYRRLTGSVEQPRFPFLPGTHLPCAMKSIIREGPCRLYVAQGCGIPANRGRHACLLMEDFGLLPSSGYHMDDYIRGVMIRLGRSVLQVGDNQGVAYESMYIGIRDIMVGANEIGCALAASPYFTLARSAYPHGKTLREISLDQWEAMVTPRFLYNNEPDGRRPQVLTA